MSFPAVVLVGAIALLAGIGVCWWVLGRWYAARLASASAKSDKDLQELRDQLDWYSNTMSFADIGIWEWTAATDAWRWSDQLFRVFGLVPGKNIPDTKWFFSQVHHDDAAEVLWRELACVAGNAPLRVEYRFFLPTGEMRWMRAGGDVLRDESGQIVRMMGVVIDITDEKRKLAQTLQTANYDELTGLPNRAFFKRQVENFVNASFGKRQAVALACIDLSGFKRIGDEHGHVTADRVLQQIAQQLRRAARAEDVVCRIGPDEFAILFNADGQDPDTVEATVRDIATAGLAPVEINGVIFALGANVGISSYPTLATTPECLLTIAERARSQGQAQGSGLHIVTYAAVD